MPVIDAYGERKAMAVRQDTWGHLAPKPRKKYKGQILFSVSEYSGQGFSIIKTDFPDLDGGPWFYDAMQTYIFNLAYAYETHSEEKPLEEGAVYIWTGTYQFFKGGKKDGRDRYLDESSYKFEGAAEPVPIPFIEPMPL